MKKIFLTLFLISIAIPIFGQDTLYFDDDWKEITSFKSASYYKIVEKNKNEENQIIIRVYFKSGQIKYETEFYLNNKDQKIYNGINKVWYDSGELRFFAVYLNGKKNGEFLSYWKNGTLKRKDFYKNGKIKKGECWNENGEKVAYYDFEIRPSFPGGETKMYAFIKKNLKYPPLSKQYNLGGKVVVGFKINKEGKVSDLEIIESVNEELDQEALRIISSMPRWEPGYHDGILVDVTYSIPIIFRP